MRPLWYLWFFLSFFLLFWIGALAHLVRGSIQDSEDPNRRWQIASGMILLPSFSLAASGLLVLSGLPIAFAAGLVVLTSGIGYFLPELRKFLISGVPRAPLN